MKRWFCGAAMLALLTVSSAAQAQLQGRPLFSETQGFTPAPGGYQIIGFTRHGYATPTDAGINVFNRGSTLPVSTPPAAGGTNNFLTQIPGSVFRGPIFVPTPFSFR